MQLNRFYVVNVCFKRTQENSEEGGKSTSKFGSLATMISHSVSVKGSN